MKNKRESRVNSPSPAEHSFWLTHNMFSSLYGTEYVPWKDALKGIIQFCKLNLSIRCCSAYYIYSVAISTGSRQPWLAPLIKMITTQKLWHIKIRNRCMSHGLSQYPMVTNVHYISKYSVYSNRCISQFNKCIWHHDKCILLTCNDSMHVSYNMELQ